MAEQSHISSFIAPLWWIRAFETSIQMRKLQVDPFHMIQTSGLVPALTESEMTALLVVLNSAQTQLLSGQRWLYFGADSIEKHNSAVSRTRSFLFLRLLQVLRSLQVSMPGAAENSVEPIVLFEKEERRRDNSTGTMRNMYKLAPLAAELILGYGEPYSELVKLLDGKPRVHRVLGRESPLVIRPSIWLELSNLEQYVFLQLQKASLWERASFRWDSVFGKGFESLFNGLGIVSKKKGDVVVSSFQQKLRLLSRIGNKLADQGFLKVPQELDYLAIDHESEPLSVIWQTHDQESRNKELRIYEQKCARYFREQLLESSIKKLSSVLLVNGKLTVEGMAAQWKEVDDLEKDVTTGYLKIEGNLLLSIPALFFEWLLRQKAEGLLQLPGWIKESPAVEMIQDQKRPIAERLTNFAIIIKERSEYLRDLETLPRATFAAPVTLRQGDVLEYLASHTLKNISRDPPTHRDAGLFDQNRVSAKVTSAVQTSALSRNTSSPEGDLRRQAADALAKMREKDPKRYVVLKQKYLESLESDRKQIILEMKDRMQPSAFDDHLRYSLVKYMAENPKAWVVEPNEYVPGS